MRYNSSIFVVIIGALFGPLLFLTGCDSAGTASNQPPTADATASASVVDRGTEVTLDASGSSDPDGDDLSYNWSLDVPQGSGVSITDPGATRPTFTPDVTGEFVATVEVSDGEATDTDQVTVTAEQAIEEISSDITSDRTLTSETTYVVTTTVGVNDGATLTIEPGVEMRFENDVALHVDDGGALVAEGTASDPITMTATDGNGQQGWWRGVAIYSSNSNNTMDYVEVRHGGSTDMGGIPVAANVALSGGNTGAALNLTNTTLAESDNYGLYLDSDADVLESFSSNSFSGNAEAPMWIPFTNIGVLDTDSSFPSDTYVRVWGAGASMTNDQTASALSSDTPYRFSSTPSVDGSTLTIEPGVEMTFENDVAFHVLSGASLIADGTSDNPITMTATKGNGQQGWWRGIGIYSGNTNNTLNHVEVRHGGSTDMGGIPVAANVALSGGNSGAALNLTNSTLAEGSRYGLYLDSDADVLESFSANSFSGNAEAPMWIPFTNIGVLDTDSSFPSDAFVRVWGAGASITSSQTVDPLSGDTPYRFSSTPSIDGSTLTIEPGVEMTFENDVAFHVLSGASLIANGTSDSPIALTATDGNEQKGWWRGVAIYSSSTNNVMDHVEIRHGGSTSMGGISEAANVALTGSFEGGYLELTESTTAESGGWGAYCDGSDATLNYSGVTFANNETGGIGGCE